MMHRVVARRFGPPEHVLTYEPVEMITPEKGCVLVRMHASTINPSDLIPVTGAYRHRTPLPFVPGYDGVGVVTAVGKGVDAAMVGRRVLPLGSAGGWQTWKVVSAEWCVSVPDDLSDDQAALAYVNPLTARLMVQALTPKPGDLIGITAAASTIGRMLIRMLDQAGAHPIAIVRSASSRVALRDEPVATVIGEGCSLPRLDAGLDAVGGVAGARLASAVRPGNTLLHYGLLSGQPLTSALLANAHAAVRLFLLRDWIHSVSQVEVHDAMAAVFTDIRAGRAASPIAGRYPLAAFRDALAHDAQQDRRGKIIIQL